MIAVTGAFGFIGSCLVAALNAAGERDIVVVDDFYKTKKEPNLAGKWIREWIHRDIFLKWLRKSHLSVDYVFHLGARTDTTSSDQALFDRLNLEYSKELWELCSEYEIPMIYASSAATYGSGDQGYADDHDALDRLSPLNAYARSKHAFDLWALAQSEAPPAWAGLKFFNVYGPNEYHKGRMASVVWHTFRQIRETGRMELFRSHREDIADGEQRRDFIYVKDVVDVCIDLMGRPFPPGLYNVGTGKARTFLDLATATFRAMDRDPDIVFIDTPEDIRDTYQYFTEADMTKLRSIGYERPFTRLEEGINDYVQQYLLTRSYY
ncbi:MAG: ADP-glyceromanno-heptose 6-epimerase [Saprospiraceae bacterium]|nr:ADP-glyceromanno-heptose 6-epimerase [Saprospiraceae bacterium]